MCNLLIFVAAIYLSTPYCATTPALLLGLNLMIFMAVVTPLLAYAWYGYQLLWRKIEVNRTPKPNPNTNPNPSPNPMPSRDTSTAYDTKTRLNHGFQHSCWANLLKSDRSTV